MSGRSLRDLWASPQRCGAGWKRQHAKVSHKLLLLCCLQDWLTPCLASLGGARRMAAAQECLSPCPGWGLRVPLWSLQEWAAGVAANQK